MQQLEWCTEHWMQSCSRIGAWCVAVVSTASLTEKSVKTMSKSAAAAPPEEGGGVGPLALAAGANKPCAPATAIALCVPPCARLMHSTGEPVFARSKLAKRHGHAHSCGEPNPSDLHGEQ